MLTQHEISTEEHLNWYANACQDAQRYLLIVEESQQPIGFVQFSDVALGGVSHWGFYASPFAPKGSGKKLGTMALHHAFTELKLHKVCGQVISRNEASLNFHKRLGFRQEGVLRDQRCIEGVYHSVVCFGLLGYEWQELQPSQEHTHDQH